MNLKPSTQNQVALKSSWTNKSKACIICIVVRRRIRPELQFRHDPHQAPTRYYNQTFSSIGWLCPTEENKKGCLSKTNPKSYDIMTRKESSNLYSSGKCMAYVQSPCDIWRGKDLQHKKKTKQMWWQRTKDIGFLSLRLCSLQLDSANNLWTSE